jgi:LacI family transcriptional regulator
MAVTIKDIAKNSGVCYSTVSKALRDSPLVNKETRQRIKAIAAQLGYQPNIAARSLVSKKSFTVGIIWPTIEGIVLSTLITNINKRLEQLSYTSLISMNEVESALNIFNRYQVDAILAFDNSSIKNYDRSVAPIVSYGIANEETRSPIIDVNRKKAIYMAVNYLNNNGHSKISYIGEVTNGDLQAEKVKGFKQAILDLKLPLFPNQIINVNNLTQYDGYEAARRLLESSERPTAIIGGSDELTRGILKAIFEKNLSVPNDISIIGYDNIQKFGDLEIPFSTVGVPLDVMTDKIVEVLMNVINEKEVAKNIILEPELSIRTSCCPLTTPLITRS